MARKIRFPLEMGDGVKVRDIEELKAHFSLDKVLEYIADGKMITWLRDRYYHDIVQEILLLDTEDTDYKRKICQIFGVEYEEEEDGFAQYTRKLNLLKQYTDNKEYFDVVDFIAFTQEDLYDLLDEEDIDTIYLCGKSFSIPLGREDITYIGVNQPVVIIHGKTEADWKKKHISFQNVKFSGDSPTATENEVPKDSRIIVENPCEDIVSTSYGAYRQSYIGIMLSVQERIQSQELYATLSEQLQGLHYHIDDDIRELKKRILESGIIGMAKQYVDNL